MFSTSTQRRTAVLIGLLLLVGCSSPQAGPSATSPVGTAAVQQTMGVYGRAELPSAPFAFAAVTVYRLDNDAEVGRGTTQSDGSYGIAVDGTLPEGLPLRVVATKDGKTLGALGTTRMISKDLVRAVMQAEERETILNLASTLALAAFLKRMKAISLALVVPNTNRINFQALGKLLEMYAKAKAAAAATIAQYRTVPAGGGGSGGGGTTQPIEDAITSALTPTGIVQLAPEVAVAITPPGSPMATVTTEVNRLTQEAVTLTSQENGTTVQVEAETFGQVTLEKQEAAPAPTTPVQSASTAPVVPSSPAAPVATPTPTPRPPTTNSNTVSPPTQTAPVFVRVGIGLFSQLPVDGLPDTHTLSLGGNWNLPTSNVTTNVAVTFSTPTGLPNANSPATTDLTLSPVAGVPTRASSTETSVALAVEARQPQKTSAGGTSVSLGNPLGLPVPKPTPTPTP